MQEIIIQATFDKEREVRICMPTGSGVIQIFIDNYYQGVLTKMNGVWTPYLNPTILTGDDIGVITGMVE